MEPFVLIPIFNKDGIISYAKVSPEDADFVSNYRWYLHPKGEAIAFPQRSKGLRMHRILLNAPSTKYVDHINGDKLDNRRSNLRLASAQQNACNSRKSKNNKSGFKGVSFHKTANKWQAHIMVNRKSIYLGLYDTPEAAHEAYKIAAQKHHGEFANTGE